MCMIAASPRCVHMARLANRTDSFGLGGMAEKPIRQVREGPEGGGSTGPSSPPLQAMMAARMREEPCCWSQCQSVSHLTAWLDHPWVATTPRGAQQRRTRENTSAIHPRSPAARSDRKKANELLAGEALAATRTTPSIIGSGRVEERQRPGQRVLEPRLFLPGAREQRARPHCRRWPAARQD
jgi:hypothetical protein